MSPCLRGLLAIAIGFGVVYGVEFVRGARRKDRTLREHAAWKLRAAADRIDGRRSGAFTIEGATAEELFLALDESWPTIMRRMEIAAEIRRELEGLL